MFDFSDGRTDGRTGERTGGRADGRTDGRTDWRTGGRTDGRADGRTDQSGPEWNTSRGCRTEKPVQNRARRRHRFPALAQRDLEDLADLALMLTSPLSLMSSPSCHYRHLPDRSLFPNFDIRA